MFVRSVFQTERVLPAIRYPRETTYPIVFEIHYRAAFLRFHWTSFGIEPPETTVGQQQHCAPVRLRVHAPVARRVLRPESYPPHFCVRKMLSKMLVANAKIIGQIVCSQAERRLGPAGD